MNHSDLTRKDQVLAYLQARPDQWVDGPEISNERIGGTEGLKRVRELRAEGRRIVTRMHPDATRDVWQYKLMVGEAARTPPPPTPPEARGPLPMQFDEASGTYSTSIKTLTCLECRKPYADWARHAKSAEHLDGVKARDDQRRKMEEDGPKYKFKEKPDHIEFGRVAICPRCKGMKRAIPRKKKDPPLMPWEPRPRFDYCSDPDDVYKECVGCNGLGYVPNVGAIPGQGAMPDE